MLVKLHTEPEDVDAALAALGLTREALFEAVLAGLLARDACTANDPTFLPGIYQWGANGKSSAGGARAFGLVAIGRRKLLHRC
jgi:hypothetical protein